MSIVNDKQIQMRASEEFIRSIDEWRRVQPDLPPRAEAIRRLIATGIKSEPILRDVMKMLVDLRGVGPEHELDQFIHQIMDALGKRA